MIERIIQEPFSIWTQGSGEFPEIVLSSRIRLARNLKMFPFPSKQTESTANAVLERMEKVVSRNKNFKFYRLAELPQLQRQVLVEKHLISPEHGKDPENRGLIINADGSVSIMVNEEDHLRIQCFASGLELEKLAELANQIDNKIEEKIDYAFDEKYGFLTTCPTNLGTGMRVSVMMHLPGLVLTQQASRVLHQLSQIGIAVRGLYGEGTEAWGNLFQISNQISLGQSEKEILANINSVARKLISQEEAARNYLKENAGLQIADKANRALGILTHAKVISSQEALSLISDLRLGKTLGMIEGYSLKLINELLLLCQPSYLQVLAKKEMGPENRDLKRAEMIKEKLKQ